MSWDILVQDWGNYKTLVDVPEDFVPQPIGKREEIIDRIKKAEPTADFSDPSLGRIENDQFSIEINLGNSDILKGFIFHIHGDKSALGFVANILRTLQLRGVDNDDSRFLT